MITYSIIQKSQLEGALRLDAEYYQPEYLKLKSLLELRQTDKIIDISNFVKKGVFDLSPDNYRENGVPFVRVQNIKKGFLDEESLVFIPEEVNQKEKKTNLESLDLVLSKVGTVGEVSIIPSHFKKTNFSQNVIGVKVKKEKISAGYLLIYLLSRFGQLQLTRAQMLQVQPKLELHDVRELQIVRLGKVEEVIHHNILEIERLQEEAKVLYSQAENLLLEELGLKDFKAGEDLYSVVNFSDLKSLNRIDAEYFQPKYAKLIEKIKKQNARVLGDLVSLKKGIEPGAGAYQDEGRLFIRVSSISKQGIIDKDQKYLSDELYQKLKKDYEPKVGEILLTKDATPGMAFVLSEPIQGIISGGLLRLKLKEDIEPEYLALCINSMIGQTQVERDAGGSIIVHWKPDQVKELLVPILSKQIQQKIAGFVSKSHEARRKAKKLLEEAKLKVEEMIDNKK